VKGALKLLRNGLPALVAVCVLTLLADPAPPDPPHIDEHDWERPTEVVVPDVPQAPNPDVRPNGIPVPRWRARHACPASTDVAPRFGAPTRTRT
jgi:hypothetical protein